MNNIPIFIKHEFWGTVNDYIQIYFTHIQYENMETGEIYEIWVN